MVNYPIQEMGRPVQKVPVTGASREADIYAPLHMKVDPCFKPMQ